MNTSTHSRGALEPYRRLIVAALLGIVFAPLLMMARMYAVAGEIAPPVLAFAVVPSLAALGIWRGRRWALLVGAVASTVIVLMLASHTMHTLGVPADVMFTPFILLAGSLWWGACSGRSPRSRATGALPRQDGSRSGYR